MSLRAFQISLCAYVLIALITFGHSAANDVTTEQECAARFGESHSCAAYGSPLGVSVRGVVSAIFWPLYWSWELQQ